MIGRTYKGIYLRIPSLSGKVYTSKCSKKKLVFKIQGVQIFRKNSFVINILNIIFSILLTFDTILCCKKLILTRYNYEI